MKRMHASLTCRDADVCALRRNFAYLFSQFSDDFSVEQPYFKCVNKSVPRWFTISSCNTTTSFSPLCLSCLMDL
jgi:hypothetical protein